MPKYQVTINEYDPNRPGYITRQWPETYEATTYTDAYMQAWRQYQHTPYRPGEWTTRKIQE